MRDEGGGRLRGRSKEVFEAARRLRDEPTPAETRLWEALRERKLGGLRFRRQHAVDRFVLDFYLPSHRLAVEVDGDFHDDSDQADRDGLRTERLNLLGIGVVRVTNAAVFTDLPGVLSRIERAARETKMKDHRTQESGSEGPPPPLAGEGLGVGGAGRRAGAGVQATHLHPTSFHFQVDGPVATVTLSRPERRNPLTFESYTELRDTFRALAFVTDVKVVVITGAEGNFCSGGDVHEIIGPLVRMKEEGRMDELLAFTRLTGDLVKAIRGCPQPVIAAVDGTCVGAGAILAMASDLRIGTARSKVAFLFTRVGLSGADMGACAILPRIIGQGRASELLYTGRSMDGAEAERWGFFNRLVEPETLQAEARELALSLAAGPTFAHGMTKRCLHQEWAMGVDEAIEAEAQAQAICMQTEDFARAFHAFVAKERPVFEGN